MFTKVYKEEDVRLRGCSYNVASVYFHLKNKRDYFKSKNNGSCYDLTKCISEYTGMCEKTIKRAIATLKKLGLISTVLKGKVNHYSFPILDAIENNTPIEEVIKDNPSKAEEKEIEPEPYMEQNIEDDTELKFYEYCEEVGNLLDNDEDIKVINNILARGIDYLEFGKIEYKEYATTGNGKIMEIVNRYFNYAENEIARKDFLYYISEYNKDYIESVTNKINNCEEYDRCEYGAA